MKHGFAPRLLLPSSLLRMTRGRVSLMYGMEYGLEWNGGMERRY